MFGHKLEKIFLLVCLLTVGVFCDDEEEHCEYIDYAKDAPKCATGTTEMYRQEVNGLTSRYCCPTGSKTATDEKEAPYVCRTTKCQSPKTSALCSTLNSRFVGDKELEYEEVMRDNCTRNKAPPGELHGLTALCCVPNSKDSLVVGSKGAEIGEFPHFAALSVKCGGTIYNKRYIVTAAHCFVRGKDEGYQVRSTEDLKVTLGTNIGGHEGDSYSKSNTYYAEEIIVHEGYSRLAGHPELSSRPDNPRIFNDIALVKVDRDIEFGPRIKSLEIAPKGFKADAYADLAVYGGWGKTRALQFSQALLKANFIIRPDEKCFRKGGRHHKLEGIPEESLLCMGGIMLGVYSPSAGSGDSGGPTICRGQNGKAFHCGVTSYGGDDAPCVNEPSEETCAPSVYTEVAYFNDWVKKHAGEQDKSTFYQPYLYGEMVASPKKYEHQVHITSASGKPCGGTLISKDVVLTAAQCVEDPDTGRSLSGIRVTTGIRDLRSGGKGRSFGVKNYAVLEGFKRVGEKLDPETNGREDDYWRILKSDSFHQNDLALLKLDGKVDIDERSLPEIPELRSELSPLASEVAFPRNTSRSGQLQQREFKLLEWKDCKRRMDRMSWLGMEVELDKNILCGVETYSGGSSCDRELGGGLFCKGEGRKDVLCGVQVFRLCEWAIPNGFIKVDLYKSWVEDTMKQL